MRWVRIQHPIRGANGYYIWILINPILGEWKKVLINEIEVDD